MATRWNLWNLAPRAKIVQFNKPQLYSSENCPIYLELLWIGEVLELCRALLFF